MKVALREILSVSCMFTQSRLDVILLTSDPDDENSTYFKINPSRSYSDAPVVDNITMGIISRIFEIMKHEKQVNKPVLFVAGHYKNGYPQYFTTTVGPIRTIPTERLLKLIGKDITDDHRTQDIYSYIRRIQRKTRTELELVKRVLNGWVIANMVLCGANKESAVVSRGDLYDCKQDAPVNLVDQ